MNDGMESSARFKRPAPSPLTRRRKVCRDFVEVVRGDDGLSAYFIESVKPFYERASGSKLKSLFGFGRA